MREVRLGRRRSAFQGRSSLVGGRAFVYRSVVRVCLWIVATVFDIQCNGGRMKGLMMRIEVERDGGSVWGRSKSKHRRKRLEMMGR